MSDKISLKKREETLKISLKKKEISERLILRVGGALDRSGSMGGLYRSGSVSEFTGKLLPFGMLFDDNAQIDMWAFNERSIELPPATADVYDDYVGKCMSNIQIGGGTDYAPVMEDIYNTYFGKALRTKVVKETQVRPSTGFFGKLFGKTEEVEVETTVRYLEDSEDNTPAMVFLQTDGENSDDAAVRRLLNKHKNTPVYWFMVAIGNGSFSSLKALARDFPNVGFISFDDINMTDSELYDKLLSEEFGEWIKNVGVKSA